MSYITINPSYFENFTSVEVYMNDTQVATQTYGDTTLYTVQKGNRIKFLAKGVDASKKSLFQNIKFYTANTETESPLTIVSSDWVTESPNDYQIIFDIPADYNADFQAKTSFAEEPTGPISLSARGFYTTYPEIYVNGVRVYNQPQCNSGDTVEFRFRKLSGYTYSESFTLASDPLTITGLVEGDYETGMHYLRFTADNSWSGKALSLTVDIVDKSSFHTVSTSAIYSGASPYSSASIVDESGYFYALHDNLAPEGLNIKAQGGLGSVAYALAFDKINSSSVGITDEDIIKTEWSYGYYSGYYTSTVYITFEMPNSDVTCVMDLKQVDVAEINYYNEGVKWSTTAYGQVGDVLGNAYNNNILKAHPNKQGYTWAGWCTDEQLTTPATESTETPALGLNLYAKYASPSCTVTFNSNGGSEVASQEVESGETATEPTAPTKAGADFVYWCSDEELTTEYDFETPVTSDITLYAKWNNRQNTVTFKEGDETIATVKVDDLTTVKPIAPEHPTDANGDEFVYWTLNGVEYDFSTPVDNDITLVAYYAKAGSSKWIMSLPNCFVGLKSDVADLPIARVDNGTKALAISANEGEETAYIFHKASLTWIELQHYTVMI